MPTGATKLLSSPGLLSEQESWVRQETGFQFAQLVLTVKPGHEGIVFAVKISGNCCGKLLGEGGISGTATCRRVGEGVQVRMKSQEESVQARAGSALRAEGPL